MEPVANLLPKGGTGWELVARLMDRQLERGTCTARDWQDHLEGRPYTLYDDRMRPMKDATGALVVRQDPPMLDSWAYFERWRRDHAEDQPTPAVRRIRSSDQHARWAAAGLAEIEPREEFLRVHAGTCSRRCGVEPGAEPKPIQERP